MSQFADKILEEEGKKEEKEKEGEPEIIRLKDEGERTVGKDVSHLEGELPPKPEGNNEVELLKLVEYRYFRERLEGKRGSLGKEETLQRLKELIEKHLKVVQKE